MAGKARTATGPRSTPVVTREAPVPREAEDRRMPRRVADRRLQLPHVGCVRRSKRQLEVEDVPLARQTVQSLDTGAPQIRECP